MAFNEMSGSDINNGLDELNKLLTIVQRLVAKMAEEEDKMQKFMNDTCSELKKEVEAKQARVKTVKDAFKMFQELPL